MNPRLLAYLRSLGLASDATDEQAWEFHRGLRGLQASISNALNYNEADLQARTNCDLMIRALGYDPTDPAKLLVTEPAVTRTDQAEGNDGASAAGDLEAAVQRGAEQERERVAAIQQYAAIAGCSEELTRTLVEDPAVTADIARDRIFEDHRTRTRANVDSDAPAGHSRNSVSGLNREILEATMLHRSGIDPVQNWYHNHGNTPTQWSANETERARIAELAWENRRMSLEDIIRACATLDNVRLPQGRDGLIQSYGEQRAFSTSILSAVFTTNMNSLLLSGFQAAPDSTGGGWVRESDVANFQSNERARMKAGGALEKLPRGGSASHAEFEDVVETFKLARYAKQFVIDDQDVQDDTFGGVSQHAPSDLGVAAAQLRPDLVYSIIMGNPDMRDSIALFHASHSNLNTSAGLAIGTLQTSVKSMMLQQETSRNLNIPAKFLIVPPALKYTAKELVGSTTIVYAGGGTNTKLPANNAIADEGLVVVPEARLENGVTDPTDPTGATTNSGSVTTWFMAALAAYHTIEVAYRRGTGRVPQIRPFILTEGRWGIGWDIAHDIAAKALTWEGLQKNTA